MNIYKEDPLLNTNNIDQYQSNSLNVLGRYKTEKKKNYLVVECSRCSQDNELFTTGKFFVDEKSFRLGSIPCGCSLSPQWEDWQYRILMKRRAEEFNYTFLGWASEYKSSKTSSNLYCSKHKVSWVSACVNDCRRYDIVCPACHSDKMSYCTRKPDSVMVDNFLSSGSFADGTSFTRSDRLSKKGFREYWDVSCPECNTTFTSNYKNLTQGFRGCECSNFRQKQLYLLKIEEDGKLLALKFGIANNYKTRVQSIKSKTNLSVLIHDVWEFSSIESCKTSETYIKQNFHTSVLTKDQLPSGFTETLLPENLESIKNFLDSVADRAIIHQAAVYKDQ